MSRRFSSDKLWIAEFLRDPIYSMFVKAWTLMKYQGVDKNEVRERIFINKVKP